MKKNILQNWQFSEIVLSLIVLAILLTLTYGFFFEAPYSGFYFNPTNGRILQFFVDVETEPTLHVGDILKQVGSIPWENYDDKNRNQIFFEGVQPGQIVDIVVDRNGSTLVIPWQFPGFNWPEFNGRFFNLWGLSYFFWFFGMITQLLIRPKDTRWRLMIAVNYLTAIWLIAGSLSSWNLWGSSLLLHAVTWLMVPVYLHLHWLFPRSLGHAPVWVWNLFYLTGGVFAASEFLQLLPRAFYLLGFLLLLTGSILLLLIHYIRQPAERKDLRFLAAAILTAIFPPIVLGISGVSGTIPQIGPLALLALLIMPGAYFYIVYRRQMGGMELRANKLISLYIFVILFGTVLLLLLFPLSFAKVPTRAIVFWGAVVATLAAFISVLVFPPFQAFIEQHFLGIKLPYQNLQETYSTRITTSASLSSLLRFLGDELLPSLFVRQFVFLKFDHGLPTILFKTGITEDQVFNDGFDLTKLIAASGKYRPTHLLKGEKLCPWAHLILPLKIGKTVLGFWLFGRRDPDDMFTQTEIPILQSLANQTAIALSNILQTERLRTLYQANVNRFEDERLHLARELHDSILNQLAVLQMNLDGANPSPKFQEAYDGLTQRLREIVSDLRPPMLNYGLKSALEELADNLMDRSKETANITVELQSEDGNRYSSEVELHLFRIVQEACENALRHAQAKKIKISGSLNTREINLHLQDDGIGFEPDETLNLDTLISKKHFGLAGMIERAAIIGAEVRIESNLENGTRIKINWNQDSS